MEDAGLSSRAELVQRLQGLAQRAAADESLPLNDVADQLVALAGQMRLACNTSAADGPAGTSTAAAAAAAEATAPEAAATAVATATGGDVTEGADGAAVGNPAKKQRRAPREFDFSRYRTRFVALELMYVGWAFQGFARQDNTENTIEGALFAALRKVKLIPDAACTPISELQYSRCGRTDRGVSALGQVVALRLRSSARVDEPEAPLEHEFDYPRLINKALPVEVRVLGWTAAPEDFNARFSAQYREYKYFIVQQRQQAGPRAEAEAVEAPREEVAEAADGAGDCSRTSDALSYTLDIAAMRVAAASFVGEHDFRNFCKPDVSTVRSFRRRILSFTIAPVTTSAGDQSHQVYALTVRGTAFLWHQVRCMAAVLLMVGRGQERADVVSELLDIEATPRKPQYSMAPEEPLLLYACGFTDLAFRRSLAAVEANLADVAGLLHRHLIGAALTAACHSRLAADTRTVDTSKGQAAGSSGRGGEASMHIPLRRRQTEPSIEDRMARRGIPWPSEPAAASAAPADGVGGAGDDKDAMLE